MEQELTQYQDYMHHLETALDTLTNFKGKGYRGLKVKVNQSLYQQGNTITWQPFSSVRKEQWVAKDFTTKDGQLSCALFINNMKTGKEIKQFSQFEHKKEVLLKLNSHFKVIRRLDTDAEKRMELTQPDFQGRDLSDLDCYVLDQILKRGTLCWYATERCLAYQMCVHVDLQWFPKQQPNLLQRFMKNC